MVYGNSAGQKLVNLTKSRIRQTCIADKGHFLTVVTTLGRELNKYRLPLLLKPKAITE
jgi:hypothetical protein